MAPRLSPRAGAAGGARTPTAPPAPPWAAAATCRGGGIESATQTTHSCIKRSAQGRNVYVCELLYSYGACRTAALSYCSSHRTCTARPCGCGRGRSTCPRRRRSGETSRRRPPSRRRQAHLRQQGARAHEYALCVWPGCAAAWWGRGAAAAARQTDTLRVAAQQTPLRAAASGLSFTLGAQAARTRDCLCAPMGHPRSL